MFIISTQQVLELHQILNIFSQAYDGTTQEASNTQQSSNPNNQNPDISIIPFDSIIQFTNQDQYLNELLHHNGTFILDISLSSNVQYEMLNEDHVKETLTCLTVLETFLERRGYHSGVHSE